MNKELMEALDILEKEKEISKETLFEAIENSLVTAATVYATPKKRWWKRRKRWKMTACRFRLRMQGKFFLRHRQEKR